VMHGVDVNGGNWESRRASSVAESGECGSESGMGCQRKRDERRDPLVLC
jgi:hypothetical protein